MSKRDIVVISASAGGVMALVELFKSLPEDFNASILVVQHLSPYSPPVLPRILNRSSHIKAKHPKDGERLKKNTIYVAPPDYRLLVEKDHVLVKKARKKTGSRLRLTRFSGRRLTVTVRV